MADKDPGSTNIPQVTVSELAQALKRTLEDRFGFVRVRGEISGYRGPHSSGHAYFSLKDDAARLDAVIWRTTFARMRVKPEEGLEVIASGKITTFAGKSSYQIIVESLEPAGVGALMALLETRRRQLAAEGLFNADRKRPLPFLPRVVGVVTSPSGAVIRDILHRLADRFPVHVVLWPVRVQGEGSAEEIAAAIRGMSAWSETSPFPRPDVLIVARGGGSLEDLWSFNDEQVVRAAAECAIPLISAVGHETDWTLIDHAADVRAPTPTAAAEICVPVRSELISRLSRLDSRALGAVGRFLQQKNAGLRAASRGVPSIKDMCRYQWQRLDAAFDALSSLARSKSSAKAIALANCAGRLQKHSPSARLAVDAERVKAMSAKLGFVHRGRISAERFRLARAATALRGGGAVRRQRSAEQLSGVERRWESKRIEIERLPLQKRRDVVLAGTLLKRVVDDGLRNRNAMTERIIHVFEAVNYKSVLARGYTVVIDRNDKIIARSQDARDAKAFTIRFADGDVAASVARRRSPRRSAKAVVEPTQEDLF
jgi:exodeoxyribonuclease VII large subunit